MTRTALAFLALLALLLAARLCHVHVLWAEETLPLAAGQEMRAGKVLYRDLWFDKPPGAAVVGWMAGSPLGARLVGALYALLCCWLAYRFANDLWGEREGLWAAGLLGFFLVFDFPAVAIPLASDLLMLAPHLAAVWMAFRNRPWIAGALAGVAFLISPKGLFVLAACAIWAPVLPLAAAFAAVSAGGAIWLGIAGALGAYWDQVWRWGGVYAGTTFIEHPWRNGAIRTLNWMGFHAALIVGAALGWRDRRVRWLLWIAVSAAGVAAGMRFFPRYYLQLLPPLVLLAAHGFARSPRRAWIVCIAALLAIPLVRFAPAYVQAARGGWRDTAMDQDSRAAAQIVSRQARPGESLFVWGFRPEMYVYTGLHAASRFLDSQPLTGVPADRHLTQSQTLAPVEAREHRQELERSRPDWIIDGLGPYNPRLSIFAFPGLHHWLSNYQEAGRSGQSVVYRRVR